MLIHQSLMTSILDGIQIKRGIDANMSFYKFLCSLETQLNSNGRTLQSIYVEGHKEALNHYWNQKMRCLKNVIITSRVIELNNKQIIQKYLTKLQNSVFEFLEHIRKYNSQKIVEASQKMFTNFKLFLEALQRHFVLLHASLSPLYAKNMRQLHTYIRQHNTTALDAFIRHNLYPLLRETALQFS